MVRRSLPRLKQVSCVNILLQAVQPTRPAVGLYMFVWSTIKCLTMTTHVTAGLWLSSNRPTVLQFIIQVMENLSNYFFLSLLLWRLQPGDAMLQWRRQAQPRRGVGSFPCKMYYDWFKILDTQHSRYIPRRVGGKLPRRRGFRASIV